MQMLSRSIEIIRSCLRLLVGLGVVTGYACWTTLGALRHAPSARARYRAYRQRAAARAVSRVAGFRVTTAGTAPAPAFVQTPTIYIANHFTALDPVMAGTQVTVAFAGKIEITGWPLLGWITRTHGIIGVERTRRSSARVFVEAIRARLNGGVPVMVFPEGAINWGDTILPFKAAAFEAIAGTNGGRIQPVFIDITALNGKPVSGYEGRYALSYNHHKTLIGHLMHVLTYRSIDVEVRFGAPIAVASLGRKALAGQARAALLKLQSQKQ